MHSRAQDASPNDLAKRSVYPAGAYPDKGVPPARMRHTLRDSYSSKRHLRGNPAGDRLAHVTGSCRYTGFEVVPSLPHTPHKGGGITRKADYCLKPSRRPCYDFELTDNFAISGLKMAFSSTPLDVASTQQTQIGDLPHSNYIPRNGKGREVA